MDDLYRLLNINQDLVAEFSIVFSRFEYALKRTGTYAMGDENGARAAWDQFAKDHDAKFALHEASGLQEAVQHLLSHPPMKQILREGRLGWRNSDQQNVPTLQKLLLAVRLVRNNLFHGGKFPLPDGPVQEPGRDTQLLRSCRKVLLECLTLNNDLKSHFVSGEG